MSIWNSTMVNTGIILKNAIQCGLNVRLDSYTPGDGDCWYHAVVQQLRRPEISAIIDRKFTVIESIND